MKTDEEILKEIKDRLKEQAIHSNFYKKRDFDGFIVHIINAEERIKEAFLAGKEAEKKSNDDDRWIMKADAMELFKQQLSSQKEKILEDLKKIMYGKIDWIKVFKDAYESRKTSWYELGHICEWRNATDEVLFAVWKQLEEALKNQINTPQNANTEKCESGVTHGHPSAEPETELEVKVIDEDEKSGNENSSNLKAKASRKSIRRFCGSIPSSGSVSRKEEELRKLDTKKYIKAHADFGYGIYHLEIIDETENYNLCYKPYSSSTTSIVSGSVGCPAEFIIFPKDEEDLSQNTTGIWEIEYNRKTRKDALIKAKEKLKEFENNFVPKNKEGEKK